ncbi:hypothetical protein AVANS_0729 [Campylobacter sp. RM5004]|uniref:hypothetical protein n=1 Tax=Campylobacter sp. RM5004 TaxID=1660078 RepID=UPI001EFB445A|nr:hypothetical protein [Campylobacter sp. RM5004]ULO01359.1 hypothetical protein AVANS_0729 [Campylobacter sp. RM5004]
MQGACVVGDEISLKTQTKQNHKDEIKSQIKSKVQRIATELNNTSDEFISKLDEFLNNRNKKHKITDAFISDLINELKQIQSPLTAINKCLAKGWITCESHYFQTSTSNKPNSNYKYLAPELQRKVDNNEMTEREAHAEQNYTVQKAMWLDLFGKTKGALDAVKNEIKKGAEYEKRAIDSTIISV